MKYLKLFSIMAWFLAQGYAIGLPGRNVLWWQWIILITAIPVGRFAAQFISPLPPEEPKE